MHLSRHVASIAIKNEQIEIKIGVEKYNSKTTK